MAEKIVATHSISAGTGWWLSGDNSTYVPLAVWALVDIFDDAYPSLGVSRRVVGLTSEEVVSSPVADVELSDRWYYHDSEFEVVGRELK
jgi:hypothetical protein